MSSTDPTALPAPGEVGHATGQRHAAPELLHRHRRAAHRLVRRPSGAAARLRAPVSPPPRMSAVETPPCRARDGLRGLGGRSIVCRRPRSSRHPAAPAGRPLMPGRRARGRHGRSRSPRTSRRHAQASSDARPPTVAVRLISAQAARVVSSSCPARTSWSRRTRTAWRLGTELFVAQVNVDDPVARHGTSS